MCLEKSEQSIENMIILMILVKIMLLGINWVLAKWLSVQVWEIVAIPRMYTRWRHRRAFACSVHLMVWGSSLRQCPVPSALGALSVGRVLTWEGWKSCLFRSEPCACGERSDLTEYGVLSCRPWVHWLWNVDTTESVCGPLTSSLGPVTVEVGSPPWESRRSRDTSSEFLFLWRESHVGDWGVLSHQLCVREW